VVLLEVASVVWVAKIMTFVDFLFVGLFCYCGGHRLLFLLRDSDDVVSSTDGCGIELGIDVLLLRVLL